MIIFEDRTVKGERYILRPFSVMLQSKLGVVFRWVHVCVDNLLTCPGWMFVPRMLMGKNYHSICCGVRRFMYAIVLVKGEDRSPQLAPKKIPNMERGQVISWGLRSLFITLGEWWSWTPAVSVYFRLCLKLASVGVNSSAVIKKRRYIDLLHFD
jgi:hypothetical protein